MLKDAIGADVSSLQTMLIAAGFKIDKDGWFGPETEQALIAFQRRAGLVADGIAGPKTIAALISRERNAKLLSEADLERAAVRLGVPVASIKAVNTVESRGRGFLDDGRPIILYERHVAFRLLGESGMGFDEASKLAERYPNVINPKRGGYAGGAAEWGRVSAAIQVIDDVIAYSACSWGQFQIMGYHWQRLGYESCEEFVAEMNISESAQLEAFIRFIEADQALIKALKSRKWAEFAKLYNGPAYKENLYDVKLQRAYERYAEPAEAAA